MLTLQALVYIEGNYQTGGRIWNYATGILRRVEGSLTRLHYPSQLQGSAHPFKL